MQQMRDRLHQLTPSAQQPAHPAADSSPSQHLPSSSSSRPGHVRGMTGIEEAMLKLEDQLHRLTREHSDLQSMDEAASR